MNPRAKDIFLDALDIEDDAQRQAFVAKACADDTALLAAVQALLDSHKAAATLRPPVPSVGSSLFGAKAGDSVSGVTGHAEQPGDVIGGRYELLRTLGEGGFGVVYLAKQHEPVIRDVALKLLKGADSGQIVTRFEAERQTLARMDHPQIARVFDAGTTERGRPYFVMEYVDGPPITHYCNERQLGLRDRLRLLEQVCTAVQHAHQKGVIHRDLKPGNILVTQVDGRPTPKVIDFGIAKAIVTDDDAALCDQPTMTLDAQIIGTPQYMAPEQATIGQKNVDTRSDVYSLGTVLYELITGTPPFDPGEMRRMGLDAVCRMVRERVPSRPSTRIGELGASQVSDDSTWRGFDLSKLSRQVAGEIDWIVMKALEKEPSRRYQTAADLGADIHRYLRNEPVTAGPPSRIYAMRKFVRRHRIEVAAAIAVVTALFATAVIAAVKERQARYAEREARTAKIEADTSAQLAQAAERKATESAQQALAKADEAARELAKANAIADFTRQMLGGIGPSVARGRDTSLLKDLLEDATARIAEDVQLAPSTDVTIRAIIGKAQFDLGEFKTAVDTLKPTFDRMKGSPDTRRDAERLHAGTQLGSWLVESGRPEDAIAVMQETVDGYALRGDQSSNDAIAARIALGSALIHSRKYDRALDVDRVILAELKASGRGDSELAMIVSNAIAVIHRARGELATAAADWEELLRKQQATYGDDHPGTLATMSNLAFVYHDQKRFEEAAWMSQQILATERSLYEPGHPNLVKSLNNLGAELISLGRLKEAEATLLEAEEIARAKLEPTHRFTLAVEIQLMNLRAQQGRYDDAVQVAYRIRDAHVQRYGLADARTFAMQTVLIGCLADAKRYDTARRLIETLGPDPVPKELVQEQRVTFNAAVADVMLGLGRYDDARRYAAQARAAVVQPADGSAPRVGDRLLRVEQALSEHGKALTSQPTSRPIAAAAR